MLGIVIADKSYTMCGPLLGCCCTLVSLLCKHRVNLPGTQRERTCLTSGYIRDTSQHGQVLVDHDLIATPVPARDDGVIVWGDVPIEIDEAVF